MRFHPDAHARRVPAARRRCGAVLLEVVLALALFVFAAAVISSGLHSAAARVERLRNEAHAVDLACSVMAELQLGIREVVNSGEEPLPPPFEDWTARIETSVYTFGWEDVAGLSTVTVLVEHSASDTSFRLVQLLPATPLRVATGADGEGMVAGGLSGATGTRP
ncbi:MAG: hypothetical protein H7A45_14565 [Verrucomicrobiales bacterium]|nr:hypothetical protein [Verrucomicrobiales bacterium]MCP5526403.1 hypothetical protein [Verrucomicrobiales bacterium]